MFVHVHWMWYSGFERFWLTDFEKYVVWFTSGYQANFSKRRIFKSRIDWGDGGVTYVGPFEIRTHHRWSPCYRVRVKIVTKFFKMEHEAQWQCLLNSSIPTIQKQLHQNLTWLGQIDRVFELITPSYLQPLYSVDKTFVLPSWYQMLHVYCLLRSGNHFFYENYQSQLLYLLYQNLHSCEWVTWSKSLASAGNIFESDS